MSLFTALATTQSGAPVPNCTIRIVGAGAQDVTAKITGGITPIVTGADGRFVAYLSLAQSLQSRLPSGTYSVVANAPGYEPYLGAVDIVQQLLTLTIILTPRAVESTELTPVTYSGPAYVSPCYPVEVPVNGVATAAWELIEATVSNPTGFSSKIEVPVIDGQALINLQARLLLDTRPYLVPDNTPGLVDPSFSDEFTTTFASITPSGRQNLPGQVVVRAANAMPAGQTNNLTEFTNADSDGLARWLTPWSELPVFSGHYADATIWLPAIGEGGYALRIIFRDINRAELTQRTDMLPTALFAEGKTTRIRIPAAVSGAYYATLTIEQGTTTLTHPLTVRYIHG